MKKGFLILFAASLLFGIGCGKKAVQQTEVTVPVKIYRIQPDTISTYLEITGNLEAVNDAQVYAKVSGKVDKILKTTGSRVRKDEAIAVLENTINQQGLKQAEAALQSAKARYDQVKQDYERYQRLYEQKAVSQQQWDQVSSGMQEAKASVEQLEAAYQQAKEYLENTYIKAPFDGIVGSLFFDEGQTVAQGQPVVKIINTNLMKAKINVPDVHIRQLKIGQRIYGTFPSMQNMEFAGKINQIDPAIDPMSRTVQVEAIFSNDAKNLKSGMYGLFHIETEKHTNAAVVPDNAIIARTDIKINPETGETYTNKRKFVFVVNSDTAKLTEVQGGLESRGRVEIVSGVNPGDQVIVVGQKVVKDGQKVQIIKN